MALLEYIPFEIQTNIKMCQRMDTNRGIFCCQFKQKQQQQKLNIYFKWKNKFKRDYPQ